MFIDFCIIFQPICLFGLHVYLALQSTQSVPIEIPELRNSEQLIQDFKILAGASLNSNKLSILEAHDSIVYTLLWLKRVKIKGRN